MITLIFSLQKKVHFRLDTEATYFVTGFRPNATMMTAHHMLIFGCEEPGTNEPVWNCGEMAVQQPGVFLPYVSISTLFLFSMKIYQTL